MTQKRRAKDENDYVQEIIDALKGELCNLYSDFSHRANSALRRLEREGLVCATVAPPSADGRFQPKVYRLRNWDAHSAAPSELDLDLYDLLKQGPRALSDFGLGVLEPVLVERLHHLMVQGYVCYAGGLWRWVGSELVRQSAASTEERDLFTTPTKTCPKCNNTRAYTELECDALFGRHTATSKADPSVKKVGWQSWCRDCRRKDNQEKYEAKKKQASLFSKRGVK